MSEKSVPHIRTDKSPLAGFKLKAGVFLVLVSFPPVPFLWLTAVCDCINRGENNILDVLKGININ